MWAILKIYMGLVLLTIHVHGRYKDVMSDAIKTVIKDGKYIDGIFAPVSSYSIGVGGFAAVFQGVNMAENRDVAMKFSNHKERSKLEFLIRGYLKAIDDGTQKSDVEKYGISPISYYYSESQFDSSSITVMPLYECNILEKKNKFKLNFEEIDYLILFRDYVRQTKYMHSCGVRYDDIKPENIMLRKGRSVLIDFNVSTKMNEKFNGYTIPYASRSAHRHFNGVPDIKGHPLDDWESFIYVIALHMGVKLAWSDKFAELVAGNTEITARQIGNLKNDTSDTINRIRNDVKFEKLREIMVKFAEVAFSTTIKSPDYNHFDDIITAEIIDINKKNQPKPAVFSWLTGHDRDEAIKDLMDNPPTAAKDIKFEKTVFRKEDYVDMDEGFFSNRREEMAQMAATNGELRYLEEKKKEFVKQKRGESSISRYIEGMMIQPIDCLTCFKS